MRYSFLLSSLFLGNLTNATPAITPGLFTPTPTPSAIITCLSNQSLIESALEADQSPPALAWYSPTRILSSVSISPYSLALTLQYLPGGKKQFEHYVKTSPKNWKDGRIGYWINLEDKIVNVLFESGLGSRKLLNAAQNAMGYTMTHSILESFLNEQSSHHLFRVKIT
jgi:hypothetical protein